MFLDKLIPTFNNGHARVIPQWDMLSLSIREYNDRLLSRVVDTQPPISRLQQLFRSALSQVDLMNLELAPDDETRLKSIIIPRSLNISRVFDSAQRRDYLRGDLVRNIPGQPTVMEIWSMVRTPNPKESWPLDEDFSAFEELRPVRIWHYDSITLPDTLLHGNMTFHTKGIRPNYILVHVNMDLLQLMFYKYVSSVDNATLNSFFHKYIMIPLHEDMYRIFFFNVVRQCYLQVIEETKSENHMRTILKFQDENRVPAAMASLSDGLMRFLRDIKEGAVQPRDIVSTRLFDGYSWMDLAQVLVAGPRMLEGRQYEYTHFYAEYPLLKFLFEILVVNNYGSVNSRVFSIMQHEINKAKRRKFWDLVPNKLMQNDVRAKFDEIAELASFIPK